MGLIDAVLNPIVSRIKGTHHSATWTFAPPGYNPIQDVDGSQLAKLTGNVPTEDRWAALWQNLASIWWVWLAIVVLGGWGWYWWGIKPAKEAEAAAATATVHASLWTATPAPTSTPVATNTPALATPTSLAGPDLLPTVTPTVTKIPTARPTRTSTPTPTPTWTVPPTWTPLPTLTETPTATNTPISAQKSPIPVPGTLPESVSAKLADNQAFPGDSMVVTGQVNNGSVVRVLWEDGSELANVTPGGNGNFAASFVIPPANKGYHVVRVLWSGGEVDNEIDLVLAIGVSTPTPVPTWTPSPWPTWTPVPTWSPTPTLVVPTATPYPTPVGGWPNKIYLPIVLN